MAMIVVVGVLCSVGLAGGPLGPPMSVLDHGEWGFDAAYFYEEMDLWGCGTWQFRDRVYGEGWGPWSPWSAAPDKFKLQDFQTNTWLGSVEYGLCDDWDVYARVGASDAEADVYWWGSSEKESADFDYGPAWQVGTNFTICQSGPWTFGGRLQVGAAYPDDWDFSYYELAEPYEYFGRGTAELDYWQGVAYVGAACQLSDAALLYFGGGWQTLQGSFDCEYTETEEDTGTPTSPTYQYEERTSGKIKHNSAIGVAGASWAPSDTTKVGVEFLFGEAGKWGLGVTASLALP